ncbi:stomatin-like protein 1 [Haliotis rubra]|uniref:stomatin-like protein 1 n=1 Tax=Haliotis rubra TaxID=36100 RepID=UPI001EE5F539|nr:stomatin-like protein 1 [Haliotis rubra]
MSVKYTRIPMTDWSDPEAGGSAFNYGSAFTYDQNPSAKYKSAFTYSKGSLEMASITDFETEESFISRLLHRVVVVFSFILWLLTFPISVWFSFKSVPNYERMVLFRLGHLKGVKGPGVVFVLPVIDRWHKVDIRIKAFNVPPKQVLTADGAVIELGADVFFRIADVEKSITHVQNLDRSTRILMQTALLNLLVQRKLSDIEMQRMEISSIVQVESNKQSMDWGVEICRIELSQVKVLRGPPSKPPPQVCMPPGMFGGLGGSGGSGRGGGEQDHPALPQALQHLASAFLAAQGHNQPVPVEQPSPRPDLLKAAALRAEQEEVEGASEVPTLTPEEILKAAQSVITESLVQRVAAVYQFQLTGEGGGIYYLDLRNGRGSAGSGACPIGDSDASLMMTVGDLQAMFAGRMKPFQAYMNGRLRVAGDLSAAMKLEEVVKKIVGE